MEIVSKPVLTPTPGYNGVMNSSKKVIILCEKSSDGEEMKRQFLADSHLEVQISANEEEVIQSLNKGKEQIYALILILDELEMQTINNFGRHLYLSTKNPDLNFMAVIKNARHFDFEVFFFNFPLVTLDFSEVNTLPSRLSNLKKVA